MFVTTSAATTSGTGHDGGRETRSSQVWLLRGSLTDCSWNGTAARSISGGSSRSRLFTDARPTRPNGDTPLWARRRRRREFIPFGPVLCSLAAFIFVSLPPTTAPSDLFYPDPFSLSLFFLWGVGSRSRAGERPAVNHWRHRWGGGAPSRATHTRTHTHRQFYPIREMAILFPISRPSHWATNVIVSICHSAMIIRYTRPISFLFHCHWSDPTATVWNENQSFDPLSRRPSFLRRVHQTGPLMPPAYWAFIFFCFRSWFLWRAEGKGLFSSSLFHHWESSCPFLISLSLYTCLYFPSAAVSN